MVVIVQIDEGQVGDSMEPNDFIPKKIMNTAWSMRVKERVALIGTNLRNSLYKYQKGRESEARFFGRKNMEEYMYM